MRRLLFLAAMAVMLSRQVLVARAETPEQYQMNLEALYNQVKDWDASGLPVEKKLNLWKDFLNRFPHDNPHLEEAQERVRYWTSKLGSQPQATSAPTSPPKATVAPTSPPKATAVPTSPPKATVAPT